MNHPNEDILLSFKLGILNAVEADHLVEHMQQCGQCKVAYESLSNDVESIANFSLTPMHEHYSLPSVKHNSLNYLWRAAAILLIAISAGYFSLVERHVPIQVEPMKFTLRPPADSLQAHLSCAAIELGLR